MRSINQRHHDQAMYQVTVSPWVSPTLARPILLTAVKYIRKIGTRMKIGTKTQLAFFSWLYSYFLRFELPKLVRPWPDWFLRHCNLMLCSQGILLYKKLSNKTSRVAV